MIFKKSFTLSEIMIAMTVLGIIIAACVPIIMNMTPNTNAIMIKKAYYATIDIVSNLVNDHIYYPEGTTLSDITEVRIAGTNINTPTRKFSCLFASKLNLDTTNGHPGLTTFCTTGNGIIYTQDGMAWNMNNCPVSGSDVCRIDISATSDLNSTLYSLAETSCTKFTSAWGANPCGTITDRANLVGKAAFFVYPTGEVSLAGPDASVGYPDGQPLIQNIVNGTTKLLGK